MNEQERNQIFVIPTNYTDSGRLFGGMVEYRNAIETGILLCIFGYPELVLFPMPAKIRIVTMVITLLPLTIVSIMGIGGDSLFQYLGHIFNFLFHKRKLHMQKVGYGIETDKGKEA